MKITSLRILIDFLSELNLHRILGGNLCQIEAASKRYAKNVK